MDGLKNEMRLLTKSLNRTMITTSPLMFCELQVSEAELARALVPNRFGYLESNSLHKLLGTAISPTRQKRVHLLRQCTGGPKAQQEQHQTVRLRRCGVCRSPSASAVAPPSPSPLKLPARTATGGSETGHTGSGNKNRGMCVHATILGFEGITSGLLSRPKLSWAKTGEETTFFVRA
jgi:hypothetical protein